MAFLLPAVWHNGTSTYPVQYVYAAATLPAYRGQGLFGALLRQAHEEASRRGQAASFLRPGEPSLTAYYRRFGYENWFTAAVLRLSREELAALGGRAAGIARFSSCPDYGARRNALLAAHPCWIRWEERLAGQAVDTASGVLIGPDGCALCERAGIPCWCGSCSARQSGWPITAGRFWNAFPAPGMKSSARRTKPGRGGLRHVAAAVRRGPAAGWPAVSRADTGIRHK